MTGKGRRVMRRRRRRSSSTERNRRRRDGRHRLLRYDRCGRWRARGRRCRGRRSDSLHHALLNDQDAQEQVVVSGSIVRQDVLVREFDILG